MPVVIALLISDIIPVFNLKLCHTECLASRVTMPFSSRLAKGKQNGRAHVEGLYVMGLREASVLPFASQWIALSHVTLLHSKLV